MRLFKRKGITAQLEDIEKEVKKQQTNPTWYAKYNYRGEEIYVKSDKKLKDEDVQGIVNIVIQQYYIAGRETSEVGGNICYNYFKGQKVVLLSKTQDGVEAIILGRIVRG